VCICFYILIKCFCMGGHRRCACVYVCVYVYVYVCVRACMCSGNVRARTCIREQVSKQQ